MLLVLTNIVVDLQDIHEASTSYLKRNILANSTEANSIAATMVLIEITSMQKDMVR